jgi:hypothetical protein
MIAEIASPSTKYYVYEHLRKDNGSVFYVGKGNGNRANKVKGRNKYWQNVVNKAGGFSVRLVVKDIDEELAFLVETERVNQYIKLGIKTCNLTSGGEGASGRVITDDFRKSMRNHALKRMSTPKAKSASSAFMKSWWALPETKQMMSAKMKAALEKPETRKALSKASRKRMENPDIRKKISDAAKAQWANPEAREKLREKATERLANFELRKAMSEAAKIRMSDPKARQRISEVLRSAPPVVCPYCGKHGAKSPMTRWHFDNCKQKGDL